MTKSKKTTKVKKLIPLKKLDLAFTINLLSTSIKSGHDYFSSINSLKDSIPAPLAEEFQQMIQEQKMGLPNDEILINFANRLKTPAIHQIVQALLMSFISGGDSTALLDQIAQDIRHDELSFKPDKTLFTLKSYKENFITDSEPASKSPRESEVLKVDENFLNSHGSFEFIKQSLLIGKNVLVVNHQADLNEILKKHFKQFTWIDLEEENVAQKLLSLSDSPSEKGKLLTIKASNLRAGFQRLKARLAFQERNANAVSVKLLVDLFYLIPLQICFSTTKSQQSWVSEISELRTILEDGFLFAEPIFKTEIIGLNQDLQYLGHLKPTGYIPNVLQEIEMNGGKLGREIFI